MKNWKMSANRSLIGLVAGLVLVGAAGASGANSPKHKALDVPAPTRILPAEYDPAYSFADMIEAIQPAVVTVHAEAALDPREARMRSFFGADPRPRQGLGSGFVMSADGLVFTNHHVIDGATEISLDFGDGEKVPVTLLGSDANLDIALLQLPDDRAWPHLTWADSDQARVGDRVLALGNGLGLGATVTSGIISGKGRSLGSNIYGREDFLQTDAAINQGNSGGPLVNLRGEVVGMNTAIIAGANTVGFSISSNLIQEVKSDLQLKGRVSRGYLGVGPQDLTPDLARALGTPATQGAVIAGVFEDSAAADAGLQRGDVVVSVDDEEVADSLGLIQAVGTKSPGQKAVLGIFRGEDEKRVTVTLGDRPDERDKQVVQRPADKQTMIKGWGFGVSSLDKASAARTGVSSGVLVSSVPSDSKVAGRVRPGDVILEINRRSVKRPEDVVNFLSSTNGSPYLVVAREGRQVLVVLPKP